MNKKFYPPKSGPSQRAFRDTLFVNPFPLYNPIGESVRWDADSLTENNGHASVRSRELPGVVRFLTHTEIETYEARCIKEEAECAAHVGDGQSWPFAD